MPESEAIVVSLDDYREVAVRASAAVPAVAAQA